VTEIKNQRDFVMVRFLKGLPENLRQRFVSSGKNGSEMVFDGFCFPGIIDVHIHGAFGWDFSFGDPEKIDRMLDRLLECGITGLIATLITCPEEQRRKALREVSLVARERKRPPFIFGIYLEGPFLSPARNGSHPKHLLMKPDMELVMKWQEDAGGLIRIITIAPEIEGAMEFIPRLRNVGIIPALGHSDADHATAIRAFSSGCSHVTHFFNAMRPFSHREPTAVSAVFENETPTIELIGDGIHVSPEIVRMVYRMLGHKRIALISDGVFPVGLDDGVYEFSGEKIELRAGKCFFVGGHLFGGGKSLPDCIKTLHKEIGIPISFISKSVFETPCKIFGIVPPKTRVFFDRDFRWLATLADKECFQARA